MTNLKTPVILFVDPDTEEIVENNNRACAVYEGERKSLKGIESTKLDVYYSKEALLENKLKCEGSTEFFTYHRLAKGEVQGLANHTLLITKNGKKRAIADKLDLPLQEKKT